MVLSPALCLRARSEGEAAFAGFDLDAAERARLLHIAQQPGMRITCVLARANRLSSLAAGLPLTCELLRLELGPLLDRYWDEHPMASLQALSAGLTFARFLLNEIHAGRVAAPHAVDVVRFELSRLELQHATLVGGGASETSSRVRELRFENDPTPLFEALAAGAAVPDALPGTPTTVVLDFRGDPPRITTRRT
jgi:hypothetical protein